jgi:hypothetical protein
MKKRKPTLSPFAQLQRQADARRGDIPALAALYLTYQKAREAFRANPTPQGHLDMTKAGAVYWSAVKVTPSYPTEAE